MTDDERFAGRYHEQAIIATAHTQMQPCRYVLVCPGCGREISSALPDRIAFRAWQNRWETDESGCLFCDQCHQRMLAREARLAGGSADA